MEKWIMYAILSMVFAGITSVVAKFGLKEMSADVGLALRTTVVFVFIIVNAVFFQNIKELQFVTARSVLFLIISGITTSLSWIFYYRAMKTGVVSYVASIDKASIVITLLLSFTLLKEPVTAKVILGTTLIVAGMIVLIYK